MPLVGIDVPIYPLIGMVGPWELAIILVIVIIIFGAGKLPEIGGALGRGIREFKHSAREDEEEGEDLEQQQQQYAQQPYAQQQYAQEPQAPPPPPEQQPQYHADPNAGQQQPAQGQAGDHPGESGDPARRDA